MTSVSVSAERREVSTYSHYNVPTYGSLAHVDRDNKKNKNWRKWRLGQMYSIFSTRFSP